MSIFRVGLIAVALALFSATLASPQQKSLADMRQEFDQRLGSIETSNRLELQKQKQSQNEELQRLRQELESTKSLWNNLYGSWIQTVQFYLTLGLGAITVVAIILGYIGFSSFAKLKKDYSEELTRMKDLRLKNSSEMDEMKNKFDEIRRMNEYQGVQLKQLETILDGERSLVQRNYPYFDRWAEKALALYPENTAIKFRVACSQLDRSLWAPALDGFRNVLELDPENEDALLNAMELSLIAGRIDVYEELLKRFRDQVHSFDTEYQGCFLCYLEILKAYVSGDVDKMKEKMRSALTETKNGRPNLLWDFQQLHHFLQTKTDNRLGRDFLLHFVEVVQGASSPENLLADLDKTEPEPGATAQ